MQVEEGFSSQLLQKALHLDDYKKRREDILETLAPSRTGLSYTHLHTRVGKYSLDVRGI